MRFDFKGASLYSQVTGSDDLRTRIALLALEEMADRVTPPSPTSTGTTRASTSVGTPRRSCAATPRPPAPAPDHGTPR
jgi:hypothetical protein